MTKQGKMSWRAKPQHPVFQIPTEARIKADKFKLLRKMFVLH
jgi:hypothetical protein